MDRDHRLDAPDNEALSTIEQLSDRSELTTIYPHKHTEWEGIEIMSRDEREKKINEEQLAISLSLRKEIIPIALLIPLPFVLAGILLTLTANYLSLEKLGFILLPVLIIIGGLMYASYRGFKHGYRIFYKHGVRALPYILALIALLGMSLHSIFLLTEPLHTGEEWVDVLVISGAVFLTSILYNLILIFVWSSPRLSAGLKIAIVGIMALLILLGTSLFYVL